MALEVKTYYSVREFAAAIGYSRFYVRQLIRDGNLLATKKPWGGIRGYTYIIPRVEAVRWGLLDNDIGDGVDR